jgi:hypothetical protein
MEVKRIRVVDENGTMRMSISGKPVLDGLFRGKPMMKQNRQQAGFLFFTEEGTECGGLVFGGKSDRGRAAAGATLTMDAYEQDQVNWIYFGQRRDKTTYGIGMRDQPLTPITELVEKVRGFRKWILLLKLLLNPRALRRFKESAPHRLFMGKRPSGDVGLHMNDSRGRPRLRMVIDKQDSPRIEFLNEKGKVTHTLPPIPPDLRSQNGKV